MDMLSFESLHASLIRVRAIEKQETMISDRVAAHGDKKAVQQWTKLTKKQVDLDMKSDTHTDEKEFLKKVGKGF